MKRLVMVVAMALVGLTTNAQKIDLDIDPQIDIAIKDLVVKVIRDVKTNVKIDIAREIKTAFDTKIDVNINPSIDIDLGGEDYRNSDKYVQDEQEIEIPLSKPGERGKLIVDSHNGRINISGYDGQTVKVKIVKYNKKRSSGHLAGFRWRISMPKFIYQHSHCPHMPPKCSEVEDRLRWCCGFRLYT